ncbi:hypothetical protein DSLASN_41510 [Desulfoluna limicola]|uniref:Uncharacterized protein n=1 Tax=Desulfoluna limicola TaxID=2810562 RepID=A0ABM7PMB9_9BACT|nr:hypothetical protein DSLASN_41510 [Desulfoluna limicola]
MSSFPDRATQVAIMTANVTAKGTGLNPPLPSGRSFGGRGVFCFLITVATFLSIDSVPESARGMIRFGFRCQGENPLISG